LAFLQENCQSGDIVHAGPYFGEFLPALADVADNVWAFEPKEENYRCAVITQMINQLHNVELHNAALGESR
jgi:hypothetical protein